MRLLPVLCCEQSRSLDLGEWLWPTFDTEFDKGVEGPRRSRPCRPSHHPCRAPLKARPRGRWSLQRDPPPFGPFAPLLIGFLRGYSRRRARPSQRRLQAALRRITSSENLATPVRSVSPHRRRSPGVWGSSDPRIVSLSIGNQADAVCLVGSAVAPIPTETTGRRRNKCSRCINE